MFNLRRSSTPQAISSALQNALTRQGAPSGLAPDSLQVLTTRGRYAGRSVRYFRVFDRLKASQRQLSILRFRDLDPHPELVVAGGHTEQSGAIALMGRMTPEGEAPSRERADRASHMDDEHLVFWDAAASHSYAVAAKQASNAECLRHARSKLEPEPGPRKSGVPFR
jgi:hypothetical protein